MWWWPSFAAARLLFLLTVRAGGWKLGDESFKLCR
jgi:hypothetical protein